jgi:drug/metabolite transporter (DMT)-like permease
MMRGIIVFITAGLAVTLLGEKRYVHHWAALTLIVGGVAVVGIVSVTTSKTDKGGDDDKTPTSLEGILLLLAA